MNGIDVLKDNILQSLIKYTTADNPIKEKEYIIFDKIFTKVLCLEPTNSSAKTIGVVITAGIVNPTPILKITQVVKLFANDVATPKMQVIAR